MAVEQFDLVVLGSGQGGSPLATAFAAAGRTVAMIEREHVGGTCVNEGCTPTKTMIASARVAHLARRATDFGVHVEGPRTDLRMVRQRKREIVRMFRRFGAAVTVLERGPQLLGGEDPDVSEALAGMLLDEGIAIHLDTNVASVSGGLGAVEAEIESGGRRSTIAGTHLLVAAGRRPATENLGLQAAGVRTTRRGFIRVNSRLATSAEATFAIGDVNGGPAFTHVSYDDYRILRTNLLEGARPARVADRCPTWSSPTRNWAASG